MPVHQRVLSLRGDSASSTCCEGAWFVWLIAAVAVLVDLRWPNFCIGSCTAARRPLEECTELSMVIDKGQGVLIRT